MTIQAQVVAPVASLRRIPRPVTAASWPAFAACALYAALRWATMLSGVQVGGLLFVLVTALVGAGGVRRLRGGGRGPGLVPVALGLEALVLVAASGYGWRWLIDARPDLLIGSVAAGVATLSSLLVPLHAGQTATAHVLVLGGALLLLLAGGLFALQPPRSGLSLRLATAVPLAVMAVIPSLIVTPSLVVIHGLVIFALLALLVLVPGAAPGRRGAAAGPLLAAATLGAVAVGTLLGARPWVRVDGGPGGVPRVSAAAPSSVSTESFNWQQTYGAHGWPVSGATVLTVNSARPLYWKAEDLDRFDGRRWTAQDGGDRSALQGVSSATVRAYSTTLSVRVGRLSSPEVIGAGLSARPSIAGARAAQAPGTWVSSAPLRAGETYRVSVYAPDPTPAQLNAAGSVYPSVLDNFATVSVPAGPYAGVRAIAQRLEAGAVTPYAVVQRALVMLQRHYIYTLTPPAGGTDPLASFLLDSHRGYCQQFAGAMALLLRLDGIPARVAVGFSTGASATRPVRYVVSDADAHAWVEVWFPGYGWVTFDPTPGVAGGAGVPAAVGGSAAGIAPATPAIPVNRAQAPASPALRRGARTSRSGGGIKVTLLALSRSGRAAGSVSLLVLLLTGAVVAALLGAAALWRLRRRRPPSADELAVEVVAACARGGAPVQPGTTLAALAALMGGHPEAQAYLAALETARWGPRASRPTVLRGPDPSIGRPAVLRGPDPSIGRPAALRGPDPSVGRPAVRRWLVGAGAGRIAALRALPPQRLSQLAGGAGGAVRAPGGAAGRRPSGPRTSQAGGLD